MISSKRDSFVNLLEKNSYEGYQYLKRFSEIYVGRYGLNYQDIEDSFHNLLLRLTTKNPNGDYPIDTYRYDIDDSQELSKDKKILNWFIGCFQKNCIDFARRRKKCRPFEEDPAIEFLSVDSRLNPRTIAILNEDHKIVRDKKDELDPIYRDVLDLVYFEGFKYREASEILSIPLGTVKSRLNQGLKKLEKLLAAA